jgi:alpha-amylase/alpha-mannosidase (GH57 family)
MAGGYCWKGNGGVMNRYVCIHGHFYQPPRENAWLEYVEQQDSAYPFHDWNERITAECYAPNGLSRILAGSTDIDQIVNNYARISFNFGPTLLAWMAQNEPEAYRMVLAADKESQNYYSGHGSAIGQAYNHTILPLSNSRDKYTQLFWGLRDFQFRFGRAPEGMWLPETAVDLETLEMLVRLGIRYTILSPYQAKRTRRLKGRAWKDVNGGRIDPSTPHEVRLPSGKKITVFFYDGPISRAVAFENLLASGESLASRLMSAFSEEGRSWPQLVHIATDGETYGHHHKHGDMALAYALHYIETNNLAKLTNYGEYLERYPPMFEAEIWERSSWSCSHGVERWNSNCGCSSGGYPGWNQNWRFPLRQALDWLREVIAPRYEQMTHTLLRDPWEARNAYIDVVLNREPHNRDEFFRTQATHNLTDTEKVLAFKLLEMQRHAMLMYTSCGWFFDELSGIETTQVIQYAARTLQLYEDIFGESLEPMFLGRLEKAKSNVQENQDGRVIYGKFVKPAMVNWQKVAAHYALRSLFEPFPEHERIYCYSVDLKDLDIKDTGRTKLAVGRARIISEITLESEVLSFGAIHMGEHTMNAGVLVDGGEQIYSMMKQELIDSFMRADFPEVIRTLDRRFGESTYSLRSIFHDDQRKILNMLMKATVAQAEAAYYQLYETHAAMMRFLVDLRVPLPRAFRTAADFAINSSLRHMFEDPGNLDFTRINSLLEESRRINIPLDGQTLGFALRKTIKRMSEQFLENPSDLPFLAKLESAAGLAKSLPFEVNVWRAQNNYYSMLQHDLARTFVERERAGDAEAKEWLSRFLGLGQKLSVSVHPFEQTQVLKAVG